jgi:hypothetical protein
MIVKTAIVDENTPSVESGRRHTTKERGGESVCADEVCDINTPKTLSKSASFKKEDEDEC